MSPRAPGPRSAGPACSVAVTTTASDPKKQSAVLVPVYQPTHWRALCLRAYPMIQHTDQLPNLWLCSFTTAVNADSACIAYSSCLDMTTTSIVRVCRLAQSVKQ